MASDLNTAAAGPMPSEKVAPWNDPRIRGLVWQAIVAALTIWLVWTAASNAVKNLAALNKQAGFGFWNTTAGFDIPLALIDYSAISTYGRAFWVGLLNTLFVSAIGIVLATFLGFFVGVCRLSSNFMVAKIAAIYLEIVRNTPLLLQLFVWYNAVLKPLPGPRQSLAISIPGFGTPDWSILFLAAALGIGGAYLLRQANAGAFSEASRVWARWGGLALIGFGLLALSFWSGLLRRVESVIFLNNRGLFLPTPHPGDGFSLVVALFVAGLVGALVFRYWARRQQDLTGRQYPVALVALLAIVLIPSLAFLALGKPIDFTYPVLRGFNLAGGVQVLPEFVALLLGLVFYTAAFIGENVRAGIQAVPKGQSEAARALGLRPRLAMNLVIIPQAMRIIIPPLTSQYLNLTKNSSLAVAIAYPDLVQVFMGTVLNQTGQAIEVIALTMLVYLTISLTTSLFMNWYNARKALVER
jgi:general L-amino acid transport system permease protein